MQPPYNNTSALLIAAGGGGGAAAYPHPVTLWEMMQQMQKTEHLVFRVILVQVVQTVLEDQFLG